MKGQPSRRRILQGGLSVGLGSGLAALSSGCKSPAARAHITGAIQDEGLAVGHRLRDGALSGEPSRRERAAVVIVGGGVAGLACAWRLARAGFEDFKLLELGNAVGGTSRSGAIAGLQHPWGAHYLPVPLREQRALCAFLADMGLARGFQDDERLIVPQTALVRAPRERVHTLGYWEEGLWQQTGEKDADREERARFEALVAAINVPADDGTRPFRLPLDSGSARHVELDGQSAADWFQAQGFSSQRLRWYLEFATRDDFGARLEQTSAWALMHYFCARSSPSSGTSGEYMTWPAGNSHLVDGLARAASGRVQTGQVALQARAKGAGASLLVYERTGHALVEYEAQQLVLATPQFITRRILAEDPCAQERSRVRYSPWLVANIHLEREPAARGFPAAWDNVLYQSPSLGYINATHQLDRVERDTLWTWYWPLTDADEREARGALLAADWQHWRDLILDDLRRAHADIDECVTRIDVWRWGHGMVRPVPGFLWGGTRERCRAPVGAVHFAHSDLSGMALFEEAFWQGVRAGEEILRVRGIDFESLA